GGEEALVARLDLEGPAQPQPRAGELLVRHVEAGVAEPVHDQHVRHDAGRLDPRCRHGDHRQLARVERVTRVGQLGSRRQVSRHRSEDVAAVEGGGDRLEPVLRAGHVHRLDHAAAALTACTSSSSASTTPSMSWRSASTWTSIPSARAASLVTGPIETTRADGGTAAPAPAKWRTVELDVKVT